jgi:serine/threonine protein phosphatase PrpC
MELEYSGHSIKGKTHISNEDSYRLLGNTVPIVKNADCGQIFAVFDGMGSAPKGGYAAQTMSDSLIQFIKSSNDKTAYHFRDILFEKNKEIYQWGFIKGTQKTLGACAGTVAWLHDKNVTIFHAGDTVAFLVKHDTERMLSEDHSEGEGLFRYFGLGKSLEIDATQYKLEEGDLIVLVSDGVTKVMSEHQIAECVRDNYLHSADRAAQELCRLAELRGSWDDITAVVIEVVDFDDDE